MIRRECPKLAHEARATGRPQPERPSASERAAAAVAADADALRAAERLRVERAALDARKDRPHA